MDEEGVIAVCGVIGDGRGSGEGELIGVADDEVIEGIGEIEGRDGAADDGGGGFDRLRLGGCGAGVGTDNLDLDGVAGDDLKVVVDVGEVSFADDAVLEGVIGLKAKLVSGLNTIYNSPTNSTKSPLKPFLNL